MDTADPSVQSFIVKIWAEETADDGRWKTWRGHITHIPDHERRYFEDLMQIPLLITPYIERLSACREGGSDE